MLTVTIKQTRITCDMTTLCDLPDGGTCTFDLSNILEEKDLGELKIYITKYTLPTSENYVPFIYACRRMKLLVHENELWDHMDNSALESLSPADCMELANLERRMDLILPHVLINYPAWPPHVVSEMWVARLMVYSPPNSESVRRKWECQEGRSLDVMKAVTILYRPCQIHEMNYWDQYSTLAKKDYRFFIRGRKDGLKRRVLYGPTNVGIRNAMHMIILKDDLVCFKDMELTEASVNCEFRCTFINSPNLTVTFLRSDNRGRLVAMTTECNFYVSTCLSKWARLKPARHVLMWTRINHPRISLICKTSGVIVPNVAFNIFERETIIYLLIHVYNKYITIINLNTNSMVFDYYINEPVWVDEIEINSTTELFIECMYSHVNSKINITPRRCSLTPTERLFMVRPTQTPFAYVNLHTTPHGMQFTPCVAHYTLDTRV